jgi:hypothetical protein
MLIRAISVSICPRKRSASRARLARDHAAVQRSSLFLRQILGVRGRVTMIGRGRAAMFDEIKPPLTQCREIPLPRPDILAGDPAEFG